MTWLTPLTGLLAFAAVVPPLVVLYFLRLRRKRREISSTLLWRRSVEDLEANAPWQRLRPNLLLLLQLMVLLALAAAVAQPLAQGGSRSGRTVILVDRSGSMQAIDEAGGATRLDRAKAAAVRRVEAVLGGGWLGGGDGEVMVIAFDERAEVRSPFSANARQAIEAIRAIEPSDARSELRGALELARAFATTTDPEAPQEAPEPISFDLFSDGRLADLSTTVLRSGETLRFEPIGEATGNVGFEIAAAERPANRPGAIAVFASLFNAGFEPVSVRPAFSVDGVVQAVRPEPVSIAAASTDAVTGAVVPGRAEIAFLPFEQPREAVITLSIAPEAGATPRANGLASDDRASLIVPPPKRLRVLRVGQAGGVLSMLLDGLPLAANDSISRSEFEAKGESATLGYDVVILDGVVLASLPPGRYLAFGQAAPIEGLDPLGERQGAAVRSLRREHPVFRNANLDELSIGTWRLIAPRGDVEVLAEGTGGPLVMWADRGEVKVLQVAFDPLDSNWPLLRSFVNFIANAIDHLGSIDDAAAAAGLEPGDTLVVTVPVGATAVEVVPPEGEAIAIEASPSGAVAWGPVRRAGVHEVRWRRDGVEERRFVAVNRFGGDEGRLDAAAAIVLGDERIEASSGRGGTLELWPWLLGAGLVLLFVEWIVYQRRAAA
ncbi:MAG: vWA domain-containing protein [Phycisphaerales bacterium]